MASFATRLTIDAAIGHVFDHLVRPELLVRWMGDYAVLDARPGGAFSVDINGVLIRGEYVRVERPHLVEITWGELANPLMPPGATRLVVRLREVGDRVELELTHDGLQEHEATKHAIGWPHFLARLVILASGQDPGPDPWATAPPA